MQLASSTPPSRLVAGALQQFYLDLRNPLVRSRKCILGLPPFGVAVPLLPSLSTVCGPAPCTGTRGFPAFGPSDPFLAGLPSGNSVVPCPWTFWLEARATSGAGTRRDDPLPGRLALKPSKTEGVCLSPQSPRSHWLTLCNSRLTRCFEGFLPG